MSSIFKQDTIAAVAYRQMLCDAYYDDYNTLEQNINNLKAVIDDFFANNISWCAIEFDHISASDLPFIYTCITFGKAKVFENEGIHTLLMNCKDDENDDSMNKYLMEGKTDVTQNFGNH